jgi:hypothetical protein
MNFFKKLYLNNLFFYTLLGVISLFVCAFFFPVLYSATWYILLIIVSFLLLDILILFFAKTGIEGIRNMPEKLSNGDENPIQIIILSQLL